MALPSVNRKRKIMNINWRCNVNILSKESPSDPGRAHLAVVMAREFASQRQKYGPEFTVSSDTAYKQAKLT
jgi:hypothetical protein